MIVIGDMSTPEGMKTFKEVVLDNPESFMSFVKLDETLPPFCFAFDQKSPASDLRLGAALHEHFQEYVKTTLPSHELRTRGTMMN